jgi:hypothetical protein
MQEKIHHFATASSFAEPMLKQLRDVWTAAWRDDSHSSGSIERSFASAGT